MNSIQTSIEISATPQKVWGVFSDFASYPKWSSFIEQIEGSRLKLKLKQPNHNKGVEFTPLLLKVEPNKEFRWLGKLGGIPFLFVGEHYFLFENSDQGTKLTHGEEFQGLLVPLLTKMLKETKVGLENFNLALKQRVEKM